MVTAALYDATVGHVRRIDPPLTFAHRMYLWLIDLDASPRLPAWLRPFARFDGRDHFEPGDRAGIRQKLDAWLAGRGVDLAGGRVLMLTSARVLGYVFNPITVYWCHRPDGELECVVAEVHNTYGGRHAYLLRPDERDHARTGKEFYVSPFQEMAGEYRMHLPRPDDLLSATVILGAPGAGPDPLTATLRGVRRSASPGSVLRMLLNRPFVPQRVSALIRGHGISLYLRGAVRPRVDDTRGELNG
ncbi:hypothetical protein CFN78_05175 [Amycolatopsis antarctica]|uniref:DUF1365 domain-containing protein n=1 Tax=Amycolatopsis antarctica TaxID=1854586 RepID=A0A263D919_9PSEU|nr:DUF1365 domain-containing protein [Amycolatopsis antarctica]OZM74508.1 hypothetical protein CFN78_05175 [Amycolatopsis antarctica]